VVAVVGCAVARAVEDWEKARVENEIPLWRARRLRQRWQIMMVMTVYEEDEALRLSCCDQARSRGNAKTFETTNI